MLWREGVRIRTGWIGEEEEGEQSRERSSHRSCKGKGEGGEEREDEVCVCGEHSTRSCADEAMDRGSRRSRAQSVGCAQEMECGIT